MIHISNSKSSPALSSTMCTRRHKGMLQTTIILILFVCIGYGFYLYNLLQVKVKYLDTKVLQHQSQRRSLSSQLQAVYEDRARLEKSIQKAKTEFQKVKEEKESIIQEMLVEHQDKNQVLEDKNKELVKLNKELSSDKSALEKKHDKIYRDHEELKKTYQEHLKNHAAEVNDAHVEVQLYQKENEDMRNIKQSLEMQVEEAKGQYEEIKQALRQIPSDAVNFNHPDVQKLSSEEIQILKGHLGESRGQPQQWAQPRLQQVDQRELEQQQQERLRQIEEQKRQQLLEEHNRQQVDRRNLGGGESPVVESLDKVPVQNNVQQYEHENLQENVDICGLRVDPGPCHDGKIRYAYYDGLKACRGFTWGGCGGNQNNFQSFEECTSICNDPNRRFVKKELTEEQQVEVLRKTGVLDHVEDDFNKNAEEDENRNIHQPVEQLEENHHDEDDEEQRLTQEEEEKARQQEEAARRELDRQNQHNDEEELDAVDPLEELKENSKRQFEVAKSQQADMEKLVEQQQRDQQALPPQHDDDHRVEARIEDAYDEKQPQEIEEDENPQHVEDAYDEKQPQEIEEDENPQHEEDNGEIYYRNNNNEDEDPGREDEDEDLNADHPDEDRDEERNENDDNVQVDLPPAARVAGDNPEAVMNAPPNQDGIDSKDINGQDIYEQDEQDENRDENPEQEDTLEYRDDNPQEDDAGNDENNREEDEDNRGEPDLDVDEEIEDPRENDENDEDNYANEQDDELEENLRQGRETVRKLNDFQFNVRNNIEGMVPQGAVRNREM